MKLKILTNIFLFTFTLTLIIGFVPSLYSAIHLGPISAIKKKIKEVKDKIDSSRITLTLLDWTGETGYASDGIDPENGDTATTFVYRISYSNTDGNMPAAGYPQVHILKGGVEITASPFTMTQVFGGDYTTGMIYTYSSALDVTGTDYTYYFEAQDIKGVIATGAPITVMDAPDVTETLLDWTGETNYTTDGLNPESGDTTEIFTYRVEYSDIEGDAPLAGYPKVHVLKGGVEITGSPFAMTYVSGNNTTGAIYAYSTAIAATGTDYTYYFEAQDVTGTIAIGAPTTPTDAPDVIDTILDWTGEAGYISDGLDPEIGDVSEFFIYRVIYKNSKGNAPSVGYPKLHILKGGVEITGSPFSMSGVSGDYTTGAIYTYSTLFDTSGIDYTYYFEAQDTTGSVASGDPTSVTNAPDVYKWNIEIVDGLGIVGQYSSIAVDSNNYPHISYYDGTPADLNYAKYNGTDWDIETVDSLGSVGLFAQIALDSNNYPHISYYDITNTDLKYARWNGTDWDIETVDSTGIVGQYNSIIMDSNNYAHISYYDTTNADLKYAKWNGVGWDIEIVDSTGAVGQYSSIAVDSNNYARISYYDATNTNLKYAKWNGAGWDIETVDNIGVTGQYTSIDLDSNSYAHISYYYSSAQDLKYAKWNGTDWDIETVDSSDTVGQYTSIELDSNNRPHISYYDGTPADLNYAKYNGISWDIETVDSTGSVGTFNSLALDSSNLPHISYYDGTNRDLKYAGYGP